MQALLQLILQSSLRPLPPRTGTIGVHRISLSALRSGRTIIRSPGASLWMPSNMVRGAGVQTKVR